MARMIHYKLATYSRGSRGMYTEHNMEIGGEGEISVNSIRLIKRKIRKKHNRAMNDNDIVICNVIQLDNSNTDPVFFDGWIG